MPFQAVPEAGEPPMPAPTVPTRPGPAVRRIPREKPATPATAPETEGRGGTGHDAPRPVHVHAASAEPARAVAQQAPRSRPNPGAGAARLLGADPIAPRKRRGTMEVWGPRLVAVVLVALLLIALALIVRGVL